ncbi:SbmA/BacA-like family transporter [Moritella viscosa]|uniref:SbmA/BacA-like family transporter n=1 Tax=Moritella viscosa TaxID=80854 RepID=UPI0009E6369D|nr:SbmA/BacA-like family transporter [Moritella viscosa]
MFRCFFLNKKWFLWSVYGTTAVVLINWLRVGVDVELNYWDGEFYDLLQSALVSPNAVSIHDFKDIIIDFFKLTTVYVVISVVVDYFIRHWIFRWRCAMNELTFRFKVNNIMNTKYEGSGSYSGMTIGQGRNYILSAQYYF